VGKKEREVKPSSTIEFVKDVNQIHESTNQSDGSIYDVSTRLINGVFRIRYVSDTYTCTILVRHTVFNLKDIFLSFT